MLKTTKSKIILGIILAVIILFAVACTMGTSHIDFTKGSNDSLQSVEIFIGQDIKEAQPMIDESLLQYNNKNYQYLYEKLFTEKIKDKMTEEEFNKTFTLLNNMFGNYISYDMEKAEITISKNNHKETIYSFTIPAKFEKWENGIIKIQIFKNKLSEMKLYQFSLSTQ